MRFSSYALPALAAKLAAALPAPQDINIDMVIAAPDPTYTESLGLTAQVVTYDTTAIAAAATAAVSSVSVAVTDVLDGTAVVSATPTAASNDKRELGARGAACTALPTGVASYALSVDTASAFRANGSYASIASNAPVPSGYVSTVVNAGGANSGYGYLGYSNLASYDTNACAAKCSKTVGCMAFNIYFERDPSVDPGTGNSGCANPSSVVYAKCALWGGPLNSDNAVNKGQMRNQFEIAVAGSNAYQNNSLTIPAGYSLKGAYNNVAINAPYDVQGYNSYIFSTIFTDGPFNIQLCADYCSAQTKYNLANPAKDGTPPKQCNFFNTYMLYKNTASNPQGQYCAIYTETWDSSFAVNSGQMRGSDRYFVGYSYTFFNSSSPGIAPKVGDTNGAVYQARQDMTYFPSQLTATFQPYCSNLLGYTALVATTTPSATFTPFTTATATVTVTAQAKRKRDDQTESPLIPRPTDLTTYLQKRAAPTYTPDALTKYPTGIQSAACSLIVTQVTSTSTTTAATVTVTASTQTTFVTSTATAAATPFLLQISGGTHDGTYFVADTSKYGVAPFASTQDKTQATRFSITSAGHLSSGEDVEACLDISYPTSDAFSNLFVMLTSVTAAGRLSCSYPVCSIATGTLQCAADPGSSTPRNVLQVCNLGGLSEFTGSSPYLALNPSPISGCDTVNIVFV
ncbi:hypothetical protein KCU71_g15764, partial [Aureobasidium melanogenum]